MTPKKSLQEFADERRGAQYAENESIARDNRMLRSQVKDATERLTQAQTEVEAAHRELDLFTTKYTTRPEWARIPKSTKENHGTLLAMLSDTHYGEVVNPSEMGGHNKYDLKIAEQRTERFFRRTVALARDYLAGVKYDGIYLALNGDIVSGDIHEELVETNEASTYETILWATPRLAAGIEMWAKEFGRVHVVSTPGNHGRNSQKPRYKKRSANNADTLIAKLLARQFTKDDRVTFDVPDSNDVSFTIYTSRFVMEHGDELVSFNGSAEIGALGPLVRGTNRKQTAHTAQGYPFDYALWAHIHQLKQVPASGFISNGSVKGYDEYAKGRIFRPERAQQSLVVVTPDFGITTSMPVFVDERKSEGW